MKYVGWPEPGQLVVGEVTSVEDFGVFIDLAEYDDKEGLIHISEVASGWIKNVRDHVREGQTVVCKVIAVDENAQQIDLSLKDVNDHQHKEAIQRWKNEQKADNWMGIAFGEDFADDEYRRIANAVLEEYVSLYEAFEQAAIHGGEALQDVEIADDEINSIVDTARDNVSVPYVNVTGYIDLSCAAATGVDGIKEALKAAAGDGDIPEDVELNVEYVGAPEYRIQVKAPNYKIAERELEESAERARLAIEGQGGAGSFHRERHAEEA